MNYQDMLDSWNGFLKRTSLVVHHVFFVLGLLAFLSVISLPYYYSESPSTNTVYGAFLGGLLCFGLFNALGTAFRYSVWGDIKIFPSFRLGSYFSGSHEPEPKAEANTPMKSFSRGEAESTHEPLTGEGATGYWDVVVDTEAYGSMPITLKIIQQGSSLTGTVEGSMFASMEIEGGTITDGRATWKASATEPMAFTLQFEAAFDDYSVSGVADFGDYGKGQITGRRSTEQGSISTIPLEPKAWETLAPEKISVELRPTLEELGLVENCRQLAEEGWTIIRNAADPELFARLRQAIIDATPVSSGTDAGSTGGLLDADPAFAEAAINPKLMAVAEFSIGRGFLLGSMATTVRQKGSNSIELHADQLYFPEPFPAHNMMLTCCWATDEFTLENGATVVAPGTNKLLRHPNADEVTKTENLISMDCPAGSIAIWDGRVWHANATKKTDGQRVVLHTTYQRMIVRPNEDYTDIADKLIEQHGEPMAQLLGQQDAIAKKTFDYMSDYPTFMKTMNNGRT
jgi:hypothetical protein